MIAIRMLFVSLFRPTTITRWQRSSLRREAGAGSYQQSSQIMFTVRRLLIPPNGLTAGKSSRPSFPSQRLGRRQHRDSKPKAAACGLALRIAGKTCLTNVRSDAIDQTRGRDAHLATERRASIAVAPHPALVVIHERTRDSTEGRFILQREPRPLRRKGTACAARPTRRCSERCAFLRHPAAPYRLAIVENHRPAHPSRKAPRKSM